jgi:hypothetical protein
MYLAMTSKIIPYIRRKIRLCFYGYGYRIIIDDWTFVTGSYDDGCEAWEKHQTMSDDKKHSTSIQCLYYGALGWPASIPFTDGNVIGALLDRNGLRPSRYTLTKDGFVIMA